MKQPASHISTGKRGHARKADRANKSRRGERTAQLDAGVKRWFAGAAAMFAPSQSSMIPMLQSAQAALGYLPRDAMQVIARHLSVPPALVEGVASFYAQFRYEAPGKHRVTICRGTACHVRGSGKLMDEIGASLGVEAGRTTANGEFTLETVACFGACALAPVVVIDGKVSGRVSVASLKTEIDQTATAARPARAAKAKG
ncbi:MAG: NAD(P)H-dependent oxidoreductase subunit E [Burkholderiales bacterium]|jgi:NADH-quinone oxidoreductase subunit E